MFEQLKSFFLINRPLNLLNPIECPTRVNEDNDRLGTKHKVKYVSDHTVDESIIGTRPKREAAKTAVRKINEQLNQSLPLGSVVDKPQSY